jgi:hypothetical protein
LPAELGRREGRLQRIAEARKALEARARAEAAEKPKDKGSDKNGKLGGGSQRGRRTAVDPKPKAQHNFTDPESRIMKGRRGSCRPTTRRPPSSPFCS